MHFPTYARFDPARSHGLLCRVVASGLFTQVCLKHNLLKYNGEPCWIRTSDLLIKSQLLYRLS